MTERVIRVTNLTKYYRHYPRPSGRLVEWLTGGRAIRHEALPALQNVTFDIAAGEAVAIVGVNGAGKSTLLSILMGTVHRSDGGLEVNGSIAGLLELGLGLHPGFSGEQNARLALQMRGAAEEDIDRLLEEVIAFSELGKAIKRPVRTYSTGMQMRLGFAIATAQRPDILIIDEALAVGDAPFQFKCIERIRSFKEQGTTLLFVSHDLPSMKSLCERAILLHGGEMLKSGGVDEVLDAYNALISGQDIEAIRDDTSEAEEAGEDGGDTFEAYQVSDELKAIQTRSGSGQARLSTYGICDERGQSRSIYTCGDRLTVRCLIDVAQDLPSGLTIGLMLRDRFSQDVFGCNTFGRDIERRVFASGDRIEVAFQVDLELAPGHYFLTLAVHAGKTHLEGNYDWIDNAATFEILPDPARHFAGRVNLPHDVSVIES